MQRIQTMFTRFALTALAGLLLSGCLLTDELGLRPVDSASATEVKQRLQLEATQGFILGCTHYLAEKEGVAFDCEDVSSFGTAAAIAYLLAPTFAGVEEGAFYQNPSVALCADRTFVNAFLFRYYYRNRVENASTRPDVRIASSGECPNAGFFAAYSTEKCDLQKTGRVIELTDPLSI